MILLPGLDRQLNYLLKNIDPTDKSIIIFGSGCEEIAKRLFIYSGNKVEIIVEDYDSLMNSRLQIQNHDEIRVRVMGFEHTDFNKDQFDLVYCQASIIGSRRKGMIKEIKRILKTSGIFCLGEITKLQNELPTFVTNIFDTSDIDPILYTEAEDFYTKYGFGKMGSKNLSDSLSDYYSVTLDKLEDSKRNMEKNELSYYKKLLNQISHESNVYLNQGGEKYIGFKVMIFRKSQD